MPSDLLDELRGEMPDPARVTQIQGALLASLKPVKPLPSDGVLVSFLLASFLVVVVLGAMPLGLVGLERQSWPQRTFYDGSLLLAASSLAAALVSQLIPAAKRRFPLSVLLLFPLLVFALVTLAVFPQFSTHRFVNQGIPCLRLGLLCAIPSGFVLSITMRLGFITDWILASTMTGGLSGLVGMGVLALHCPIQNSAHILVWHLGVIAIAMLAGAIMGLAIARR